MATMLDVSIRAGVSKATVSRVLNGTGQVKESTRQQVFKAMEELGYRPNFLARSLANQTSNRSAKRKRCRCSPTGSAMRSSSIPGT